MSPARRHLVRAPHSRTLASRWCIASATTSSTRPAGELRHRGRPVEIQPKPLRAAGAAGARARANRARARDPDRALARHARDSGVAHARDLARAPRDRRHEPRRADPQLLAPRLPLLRRRAGARSASRAGAPRTAGAREPGGHLRRARGRARAARAGASPRPSPDAARSRSSRPGGHRQDAAGRALRASARARAARACCSRATAPRRACRRSGSGCRCCGGCSTSTACAPAARRGRALERARGALARARGREVGRPRARGDSEHSASCSSTRSRARSRAPAGSRPLLIVLEDLQWADPPSLRLLEHLAFEAASEPILVLASVREEFRERGHPLDRTLGVLRQQERSDRARARRLLARARSARCSRAGSVAPAPSDLISELFARTEGVPLFLREAIRLLARARRARAAREDPALGHRPAGARARPDPARARRAVGARARARRRRRPCSGASSRWPPRPRSRSSRATTRSICVDEATRAGVLEASPDDAASWRFTHALFQEAAYAGLAAGERVRLHLRAAQRLEREHASDLDAVIAELAHHHHRALARRRSRARVRVRACAPPSRRRSSAPGSRRRSTTSRPSPRSRTCGRSRPSAGSAVLLALGETCRLSGERTRRREVLTQAMALARDARPQRRPGARRDRASRTCRTGACATTRRARR